MTTSPDANPNPESEAVATKPEPAPALPGPVSHANWAAMDSGVPSSGACEITLYSDARFTGEIVGACGPYTVLNLIHVDEGHLRSVLALRAEWHVRHDFSSKSVETDVSNYTGSSLGDEIAVLLALAVGGRLAAGGETRRFDGRDVRGQPINDFYPPPALPLPSIVRAPVVPTVREAKALSPDLLSLYRRLSPTDAIALVRAARAYRDALWIADAHPEMAWLLMVSAIETAAAHEAGADIDPEIRLREVAPKLAAALDGISDTAAGQLAPHVAHLFKATSKFLKFVEQFLPDEPTRRPPQFGQVKWTNRGIKDALNIVYDWRSQALHAGMPFPSPMCMPPTPLEGAFAEKVIGLAAHTQGATWNNDDTPLNLHIFEYITRGVLQKWWRYLSTKTSIP